ncbi:MAG TPA: MoaF N-terminal domain-containing protein [Dehalococcoidia bacterium]|nr:MoaF N-terminal domain-containing protein [Dehalococcoidia bacterium]
MGDADAIGLRGKRLHIRYDGGIELLAEYGGSNELAWKALAGPAAGAQGREVYEWYEAAPGVFFVAWLERTGTTVSQILDLQRGEVAAYVTFETPGGRQAVFMRGSVREA